MSPQIFISGEIGARRALARAKAVSGRKPAKLLCPPPPAADQTEVPAKKQPQSVRPVERIEVRG